MELRHLRCLIAVAEEGHITRAAERLGMAQPALSRVIKTIEQEIDLRLFRRVSRGVELTDAGRSLLDGARTTFANLDRALESARRSARGEEGRISVAFTGSAALHPLVPDVIREFRKTFPLVSVSLAEGHPADLIERIESDRLDAAFVRVKSSRKHGVVFHPLLEEPLVVALPKDHKLARSPTRAVLPLKGLSDETFVINSRQGARSAIPEAVFPAFHAAGFSPHIQEAPRLTSTLPLVAAGIGIAIVPASLRDMNVRGVVYRRLAASTPLKTSINLASRRGDTSAVVRQFVSLVRRRANNAKS